MNVLLYTLNMMLLATLVWGLQRQEWAQSLRPYFYPALLLKLLCGVLVGLLYWYYYGEGDTIAYFNASQKLSAYARSDLIGYLRLLFFNEFPSEASHATIPFATHAGFSNSFYFIKVVSLLNLLTGSAYWLNALYLSLFSFWGTAKLASLLGQLFPDSRMAAVVAFLFFPSVVFWGAGLLKEPVMLGSMCWVVAFALVLAHGRPVSWRSRLLLPFMLYVLVRIKLFFAALLLVLLFAYLALMLLARYRPLFRHLKVQLTLLCCFAGVPGLLAVQLIAIYHLDFVLEQLVLSYEGMLALSLHRPHLEFAGLQPTLASMLRHAPKALLGALYRPFLGESLHPLFIAIGLENLVLLLLSVGAVLAWFLSERRRPQLLHIVLLLFIVIAAILIGLSTPNFGTLSRYRIMFLPFLVYLLWPRYDNGSPPRFQKPWRAEKKACL